MKVQELRQTGRENIIQLAIERMKEARHDFEVEDIGKVRVFASDRTIRVCVGMGFGVEGKKGSRTFQSHEYEVNFTDDGVSCYPLGPSEGAELDDEDKEKIEFIKKHMGFSFGDRIYIQESEGHYEVTCSHGAEGGAECYRIDKGTGANEMIWHEHPMPREMVQMTDMDGNVIEEETFEEIYE